MVEGVKNGAAVHQVKGDLGDQGPKEETAQVLLYASGMDKALGDLEGKDGKGQPAHCGKPAVPGDDGSPQVVAEHQGHSQKFQSQGVQALLHHQAVPHKAGGDNRRSYSFLYF